MHSDSDIFGSDILPFACRQLLEWQQLLLLDVVCYCLSIDHKRLDVLVDTLIKVAEYEQGVKQQQDRAKLTFGMDSTKSGYLALIFSEFRLKTTI